MQTEKRGRGRPKSGLTLQELQAKSDAKWCAIEVIQVPRRFYCST
ncbi:hypothetical protein FHPHGOJG_02699 [Mannheimia haemolytica]